MNDITEGLTIFVIVGHSLQLSDEALKRKAPPRVYWAEKLQEVINVHCHVLIGMTGGFWVQIL